MKLLITTAWKRARLRVCTRQYGIGSLLRFFAEILRACMMIMMMLIKLLLQNGLER